MVPRKKRNRYKKSAIKIAAKFGYSLDVNDWTQIWDIIDKHGEPIYLYAVIDNSSKLVKFGKSKCPWMRLSGLRTANPNDIRMMVYCEEKLPLSEKEVHKRLSDYRVSGEWFRYSQDTQNVISEMKTAAFGATQP